MKRALRMPGYLAQLALPESPGQPILQARRDMLTRERTAPGPLAGDDFRVADPTQPPRRVNAERGLPHNLDRSSEVLSTRDFDAVGAFATPPGNSSDSRLDMLATPSLSRPDTTKIEPSSSTAIERKVSVLHSSLPEAPPAKESHGMQDRRRPRNSEQQDPAFGSVPTTPLRNDDGPLRDVQNTQPREQVPRPVVAASLSPSGTSNIGKDRVSTGPSQEAFATQDVLRVSAPVATPATTLPPREFQQRRAGVRIGTVEVRQVSPPVTAQTPAPWTAQQIAAIASGQTDSQRGQTSTRHETLSRDLTWSFGLVQG